MKITDIRVSIIVPVYNVEKYLDKCLDSLVHQTLENYEIIVVNDGTKDHCQDIIDRYVQDYPQLVHSYIKENGGLSDARNFGLQYAKGKYISFLDSDDYVETDYYQGIFELANKNGLDLVVSDLEYVWENEEKAAMRKEGLHASAADINQRLFLSPLSVCNKLFRRELFQALQLKFYKGLWYEDIPVALFYCANSRRIGRNTKYKYHYLQRKSSILGSGYSPKMYDIFSIFEKVMAEFKTNQLYDKYRDELEYLYIEHFLVYGAFRFLRTDHYRELMSKAFSFVKAEFPHYLQNPYIATLSHKNRIFLYTNTRSTMGLWHKYLTR